MDVWSHELWQIFQQKNRETADGHEAEFESAVKKVCQYGIDLSKTIQETFGTYTLHDETHICNVMTKMLELLGADKGKLTRDECAMLVMAACCHDIGMSAAKDEKDYLRGCPDCMQEFLERHPEDYGIAYARGASEAAEITDGILRHYIRANHHNRVFDQLQGIEWPAALGRSISVDEVIAVCQSHGEDPETIRRLQNFAPDLDLHLCAVLLRLGDILDFDATRAPDTLYRYINLARLDGMDAEQSRIEWEKHQASRGFTLAANEAQGIPMLLYRAECTNIQVEQAITAYLDWVDNELAACAEQIRYMSGRWRYLILPGKIGRQITAKGYLSGEYKLTLDQERVIELLIGRELYSDPAIFVRELIQNAIDAVRTRKQLDKNLPHGWRAQINIRTWIDEDSGYWFRIEDNGIGMTEDTIRKFFLRVGHSYYGSDQFQADKIRCEADPSYKPISRFGIGILSCFMGDSRHNRVEVTTKHFAENGVRHPAYRLSIQGVNGYYYLADDGRHRTTAPDMPNSGGTKEKFIAEPGTVIAVRTNLFQSGGVRGFKDIIDKYVVYPEIPIHYDGIEGVCDYKTEREFMDAVHALTPRPAGGAYQPVAQIPIPEKQLQEIQREYPELVWKEPPKISVFCVPLDYFTQGPLIKGASVIAKVEGEAVWQAEGLDEKYVPKISLSLDGSLRLDGSIPLRILIHLSNKTYPELRRRVVTAVQDKLRRLGADINVSEDFYEFKQIISMTLFDDLQGVSREELRAFRALYSNHSCDPLPNVFGQFSWFRDWFDGYLNPSYPVGGTNFSCNAHNGIWVDSSHLLLFGHENVSITILLLRDEYCPRLSLSRNLVQSVPLPAVCSLDAMTQQIQYALKLPNRYVAYGYDYYDKEDFRLIPLKDYLEVLARDPSLAAQLLFSTELGLLSVSEIGAALQKRDRINLPTLPERGFAVSVLLRHFDLRIVSLSGSPLSPYCSVCIVKKSEAPASKALEPFPPGLFLFPAAGDVAALCGQNGFGGIGFPYNAQHPFSQWLIENQAILQSVVPGIYHQMITELLHSKRIIEGVNPVLAQLRRIPHLKIPIAKDLTESDIAPLFVAED